MDFNTERFASDDVSIDFDRITDHWNNYKTSATDDCVAGEKSNDTICPNNCSAPKTSNAASISGTRYIEYRSRIN